MRNYTVILNIIVLCVLFACNTERAQTSVTEAEQTAIDGEKSISGLCLWKEVSIRETPSEKGKYLTTVYLGEKFEALPDTASEKINDKTHKYNRVKLGDGTEGWIRTDFIAIDAVPATFLRDAIIYKRPDLMTSSKKNFNAMDFVAVRVKNEEGWAEVKGKRFGDTWFTTGWVKIENLTLDPKDIMFSVLYSKAMGIDDETKRMEDVQALLNNTDLMGSVFYSRINAIYNGYEESEGEQEETDSDSDTTSVD